MPDRRNDDGLVVPLRRVASKHPDVSAKFVIFVFPRYLIAPAALSSLNDPQTMLDADLVKYSEGTR